MFVKVMNELINLDKVDAIESVRVPNENDIKKSWSKIIFYKNFNVNNIVDEICFDHVDEADECLEELSKAIATGKNFFEIE